jgi:hypothetical protein
LRLCGGAVLIGASSHALRVGFPRVRHRILPL